MAVRIGTGVGYCCNDAQLSDTIITAGCWLGSCDMQVAQYRCIVSHESLEFAEFALCNLQLHNCRSLSADIPALPGERSTCNPGNCRVPTTLLMHVPCLSWIPVRDVIPAFMVYMHLYLFCWPPRAEVAPMTSFRGKPLTHETAEVCGGMLEGSKACSPISIWVSSTCCQWVCCQHQPR
jgi:hypothetical protein